MPRSFDPYQILGLQQEATFTEIKARFKSLIRQYHPDKNPTEEAKEKAQQIIEAYKILVEEKADPEQKRKAWLSRYHKLHKSFSQIAIRQFGRPYTIDSEAFRMASEIQSLSFQCYAVMDEAINNGDLELADNIEFQARQNDSAQQPKNSLSDWTSYTILPLSDIMKEPFGKDFIDDELKSELYELLNTYMNQQTNLSLVMGTEKPTSPRVNILYIIYEKGSEEEKGNFHCYIMGNDGILIDQLLDEEFLVDAFPAIQSILSPGSLEKAGMMRHVENDLPKTVPWLASKLAAQYHQNLSIQPHPDQPRTFKKLLQSMDKIPQKEVRLAYYALAVVLLAATITAAVFNPVILFVSPLIALALIACHLKGRQSPMYASLLFFTQIEKERKTDIPVENDFAVASKQ